MTLYNIFSRNSSMALSYSFRTIKTMNDQYKVSVLLKNLLNSCSSYRSLTDKNNADSTWSQKKCVSRETPYNCFYTKSNFCIVNEWNCHLICYFICCSQLLVYLWIFLILQISKLTNNTPTAVVIWIKSRNISFALESKSSTYKHTCSKTWYHVNIAFE